MENKKKMMFSEKYGFATFALLVVTKENRSQIGLRSFGEVPLVKSGHFEGAMLIPKASVDINSTLAVEIPESYFFLVGGANGCLVSQPWHLVGYGKNPCGQTGWNSNAATVPSMIIFLSINDVLRMFLMWRIHRVVFYDSAADSKLTYLCAPDRDAWWQIGGLLALTAAAANALYRATQMAVCYLRRCAGRCVAHIHSRDGKPDALGQCRRPVTSLPRTIRDRFIPGAMKFFLFFFFGPSEPDLDELLAHSTRQEHARFGDDARDEIRRCVVHGILHARDCCAACFRAAALHVCYTFVAGRWASTFALLALGCTEVHHVLLDAQIALSERVQAHELVALGDDVERLAGRFREHAHLVCAHAADDATVLHDTFSAHEALCHAVHAVRDRRRWDGSHGDVAFAQRCNVLLCFCVFAGYDVDDLEADAASSAGIARLGGAAQQRADDS